MKRITLALALCVLMAVPAYSWKFDAYATSPDMGYLTYGFNPVGIIGQNYVLQGELNGAPSSDAVLYANLVWGEILINNLPNDYYYGSQLIGMWGEPGSFQYNSNPDSTGSSNGWSFNLGTPPPAAARADRIKRIK